MTTDKYHGTPLTPNAQLRTLKGHNFVVPFIRPDNIRLLLEEGVASKVMLDSGAYSAWRRGVQIDWDAYYGWTEKWLKYPGVWAVIGDIIDGSEEDNDQLIDQWPHGTAGAPVWHLHESIKKLERLTATWPLVCLGSSGQYAVVGSSAWLGRMNEAMTAIALPDGAMPTRLHMLRGLKLVRGYPYPFASVDSATVARNFRRDGKTPLEMVQAWEPHHTPEFWKETH